MLFGSVFIILISKSYEIVELATPFSVPAHNCFFIHSPINLMSPIKNIVIISLWMSVVLSVDTAGFLSNFRLFYLFSADSCTWTVELHELWWTNFTAVTFFESVEQGNVLKKNSELVAAGGKTTRGSWVANYSRHGD